MVAQVGEARRFEGLRELVGCSGSVSVGSIGSDEGGKVNDGMTKSGVVIWVARVRTNEAGWRERRFGWVAVVVELG